MKKLLALLLAALMLSALCACGAEDASVDDSGDLRVESARADDSGDLETLETPVDDSGADTYVLTDDMKDEGDTSLNQEKYDLAMDCVGESVEVLYDTIGQPEEEPHYASSCLEMGAQDGQLYYDSDGFYVTTLKNDDGEVVMGVVVYYSAQH